ncbi:hypothetical protein NBRC111893_1428 [Lentilactobacillus kosonis]|uniref:Uncharacterized protein n=1 Tax=Lentilactobacillus kosonis TaxID=2810561 RepID=A0A401FLL6_9LACO|nr:hypothetical protein NBRC111893_1428 [Lentilactobacillus kosonis]
MKVLDNSKKEIELRDLDEEDDVLNVDAISKMAEQKAQQEAAAKPASQAESTQTNNEQ